MLEFAGEPGRSAGSKDGRNSKEKAERR